MFTKGVILASADRTVDRPPLDSRLAPPLVPVANRPILFHALEAMREAGIAEVAIVASESSADDIRDAVGGGERWGLELTHLLVEGADDSTAPLHAAQDFVEDRPFILQRGDGLLGDALSSFSGLVAEGRPDVVLLVHRQLPRRPGSELEGRRLLRAAGVHAGPSMTGVAGVYLFGEGALRGTRHALNGKR
jgi:glucose-1-phosphate thymidylyltransferase